MCRIIARCSAPFCKQGKIKISLSKEGKKLRMRRKIKRDEDSGGEGEEPALKARPRQLALETRDAHVVQRRTFAMYA